MASASRTSTSTEAWSCLEPDPNKLDQQTLLTELHKVCPTAVVFTVAPGYQQPHMCNVS